MAFISIPSPAPLPSLSLLSFLWGFDSLLPSLFYLKVTLKLIWY
uniref:Uncharacterized protein n=1 Tax=Rhizophora mucronata TaxID=61149 RepID=A0A2P2IUP5_RHIMU